MTANTVNPINPNLINTLYQTQTLPPLQLTQIDGYEPVREFTDSTGSVWQLVKAASSGMNEIPDPRSVNVTDYWNHEYPGSSGKVFIYVVEGVRVPKTSRENACKVLYCWFSTVNNQKFTPQMIRESEWLMANVYAAVITDARVSKLKALCKIKDESTQIQQQTSVVSEQPAPLIKMENLNDTGTDSSARSSSENNKRKHG